MKLTNDKKRSIQYSAIESLFAAREQSLREEEDRLGNIVYNRIFSGERVKNLLAKLPPEWPATDHRIFVQIGSREINKLVMKERKPVPYSATKSWREPLLSISEDSALAQEITKFRNSENLLEKHKREANIS